MKNYLLLTISICFVLFSAKAQPGALDLSFDPGTGANGTIQSISIQSNGKIIIGGAFTAYNGTASNRIARLNTDGSLDTSFHPGTGADLRIFCTAVQNDGKIIIGGEFVNYNGTARSRIARLNSDGSIDSSFNPGSGANNIVNCIAIQSNGLIVIGGEFNDYNGTGVGYITRLNTNGSRDGSFTTSNANGAVNSTAIQPGDGRIIIGGGFTTYGGGFFNQHVRIARLNTDGSADGGFNQTTAVSSTVQDIAIQSDGRILIAGVFTTITGATQNRISRLNSNGDRDANFNNTGAGASSEVHSVSIQGDGKIIIGGDFTSYNATTANYVARVNQNDGTLDNSFISGTKANGFVYATALQSDGRILIGGSFTGYDGISRNKIARLYGCQTPTPGPISGSSTTVCPGTVQHYSINPVSGANSYSWSLPAGWTGSSDSTSIVATSNGKGGIISVVAKSDSCGPSDLSTLTIIQIKPPDIPICLVTVDTLSTHNIIMWEKPITALIDSFFIYREVSSPNYAKIASVSYDSLSEYHDYGANPNATSYKYKLSTLDTCGVESALSDFHGTIHLQNLQGGNFQWTLYDIENAANPVINYNFKRDDQNNGNFLTIQTLPGGNATFTDVDYASFPIAKYVLDVDWSISCTPTRAVNTTRSNVKSDTAAVIQLFSAALTNSFNIYPNPCGRTITISSQKPTMIRQLEILNLLGEIIYREDAASLETVFLSKQINTAFLPQGAYILRLKDGIGRTINKLIVHQ